MGILLKIFQLLGAKFTKDFVIFSLSKVFFTSLILVALPIALSSALLLFYQSINDKVLAYATGQVSTSSLSPVIIQVTGLAAWMVNHLQLIQAFNIIISAIALRVLLNLIPFSRV